LKGAFQPPDRHGYLEVQLALKGHVGIQWYRLPVYVAEEIEGGVYLRFSDVDEDAMSRLDAALKSGSCLCSCQRPDELQLQDTAA
jgi:hypothetical protein